MAITKRSSVILISKISGFLPGYKSFEIQNVVTKPKAVNKTVPSNVIGIQSGNAKKSLPPMIIGQSKTIV